MWPTPSGTTATRARGGTPCWCAAWGAAPRAAAGSGFTGGGGRCERAPLGASAGAPCGGPGPAPCGGEGMPLRGNQGLEFWGDAGGRTCWAPAWGAAPPLPWRSRCAAAAAGGRLPRARSGPTRAEVGHPEPTVGQPLTLNPSPQWGTPSPQWANLSQGRPPRARSGVWPGAPAPGAVAAPEFSGLWGRSGGMARARPAKPALCQTS
jgi:hypothetical protein